MRAVLEALVAEQEGVTLVRLEQLPPEQLVAPQSPGEDGEAPLPPIYRHTVRLVVRASYRAVTAYLQSVESLDWQFNWQSMTYQVETYPQARVTLELSTLSGYEAWIGV
ncbi:hypothetical protein [Halorhodospira neutriphila]|uniref:Uncharacterized protein n=1 Tax=Halorhodospira neutriphila TaxID=168379 RepID=A0ABS1E751_9GAMM|nr:hypothetical protein [Halorhodospira neutriphila]